MNFKIEINYLNIDNYPSLEKHFEKRAREGWLIEKVWIGSLLIYKRIEPQELEFSISPYEVETALTRKSKEDLEEFRSVSERVGWNYATKSYDLHIYYKAAGAKAVPMHTDAEEEFRVLEKLAKRYLRVQYISLPLLFILSWFVLGGLFTNIRLMKDGLTQLVFLAVPFGLLASIKHIYDLRKFLKLNRKRIEQGKELAFNSSKQWMYRLFYSVFYLLIIGILFYLLYSIVVLGNFGPLSRLLPLLIGACIGLLYRAWIKPKQKGLGFKFSSLVLTLIIAGIVGVLFGFARIYIADNLKGENAPDSYKVLTGSAFFEEENEEWGDLTRNASLLMPASYDYTEHVGEEMLETEYARALTAGLAENLVERYMEQQVSRLRGRYSEVVGAAFGEGEYPSELEQSGFLLEDFEALYEEGAPVELDAVWGLVENRSITDANQYWLLDEAYFLSYDKEEIVLREGREVFYLSGLDFSKPEVVEEAKRLLEIG